MSKTFNEKKIKYSNHRSKTSLHKSVRNYVNSYINHIIRNNESLYEFDFPANPSNTYTWWDCNSYKSKVYKIIF